MKRKLIALILIVLLVLVVATIQWYPQQDYRDVLLDRSYTGGGINNMSNWSVGFQWMGDPEEFRDDILAGSFSPQVNGPGSFSMQLPLDEFALNLLGDTVVRIYYDGEPQFWGFIEKTDIDESMGVVNIMGGDMIKRMGMRKVEYQSTTAGGADPPRGDVGSKAVFEELIHWWTGETDSDSMFRNEFIERSETEYRYNFDGNWLSDALADVAHSCSLTVGDKKHIGYGFWVNGYGDIFLQPYGAREYQQEIPGQWRLSQDWSVVKNRIHLRGGIPEAWMNVENEEENYSIDVFETDITSNKFDNWDVTCDGVSTCTQCGDKLGVSKDDKQIGAYSGQLTTVDIRNPDSVWITQTFPTAKDWSYIDEGGNVQSQIAQTRIHFKWDHTGGSGGFTIYTWFEDSSANTSYWGSYESAQTQPWTKAIRTLDNFNQDNVDWNDIKYVKIMIYGSGAVWQGSMKFDGLAVFFKEVDLWRKDNASIAIHGLKEAKFQDRRITDWKAGEKICEQILDLLKTPAVIGNTSVPYYDPNLHLNDLINVPVEGVTWPLYVNKLEVSWSGDHVSTTIHAGRPVPSEEWITAALHILRDQDSEKGTGFQMASTYEQSTCFKDKELFCRSDCQASNCQNEMQLQSCFTFAERDPCIATCQRYKERTGWLNRILE